MVGVLIRVAYGAKVHVKFVKAKAFEGLIGENTLIATSLAHLVEKFIQHFRVEIVGLQAKRNKHPTHSHDKLVAVAPLRATKCDKTEGEQQPVRTSRKNERKINNSRRTNLRGFVGAWLLGLELGPELLSNAVPIAAAVYGRRHVAPTLLLRVCREDSSGRQNSSSLRSCSTPGGEGSYIRCIPRLSWAVVHVDVARMASVGIEGVGSMPALSVMGSVFV